MTILRYLGLSYKKASISQCMRALNSSSLENRRNVLWLTQNLHVVKTDRSFFEVASLLIISLPSWTYKERNFLTQRDIPENSEEKPKWAERTRSKVLPNTSESQQGRQTVMVSNGHPHKLPYFQLTGTLGRLKNYFPP